MRTYQDKVMEAASFIRDQFPQKPIAGLLTGTGLGDSGQSLRSDVVLPYKDIPHFPVSTVQSHRGRLLAGMMADQPVIVLQGRFHLYEGYSPLEVTFPIRVLQTLGVTTLILTNAAGGLNPKFKPGDIMIIKDHINLTGANPLIGPNHDAWGDRFPDMSAAYNDDLISISRDSGSKMGFSLKTGIYAGLVGPSLETPSEVHFIRTIGGDAVGFSTVQEVISAVHAGMHILAFSIITNAHDLSNPVPANVEEIIAVANSAAPRVNRIITDVVGQI